MLWPELIAGMFNLDAELTKLLIAVLWVVALSFIVDAWQLLAINLLRGMKIVVAPTIMTAIGYWLFGLPAARLLMQEFGLGGIWAGIGIGLGVTGILLLTQLLASLTARCKFAWRINIAMSAPSKAKTRIQSGMRVALIKVKQWINDRTGN